MAAKDGEGPTNPPASFLGSTGGSSHQIGWFGDDVDEDDFVTLTPAISIRSGCKMWLTCRRDSRTRNQAQLPSPTLQSLSRSNRNVSSRDTCTRPTGHSGSTCTARSLLCSRPAERPSDRHHIMHVKRKSASHRPVQANLQAPKQELSGADPLLRRPNSSTQSSSLVLRAAVPLRCLSLSYLVPPTLAGEAGRAKGEGRAGEAAHRVR